MTRAPVVVVVAMLALAGSPAPAVAQAVTATLTGAIADPSGAGIRGAEVTAVNTATNVPSSTRTNDAGLYTIAGLPPGTYTVRVQADRFKSAVTNPMTLEVAQTARVDLTLEVGQVQEQVEVTGVAPILQTQSAVVGEVISGTTAAALPLNGRNFAQLTLLVPGSVTTAPDSFGEPKNFGMGRPYVNGNREQGNNFMLDGVDMNEAIDNLIAYQPSPDALAEVRVETNNYSAEFGNVSGAIVNAIMKSGTNRISGSGFEFFRNDALASNRWENERSGTPKAELDQHIFGGTVGGPLRRDRLFFFANYQGFRRDLPGGQTASVAPETWRNGDFSSLLGQVAIVDPRTGQPFAGNVIPTSRFSPTAQALLARPDLYPLPTSAGASGNFGADRLNVTRNHQADVKIDATITPRDTAYGRFSWGRFERFDDQRPFPLLLGVNQESPTWSLAFNWNRALGVSAFNEVRFGVNRVELEESVEDWGGIGDFNATVGIPGGQRIPGLSAINFGTTFADSGGAGLDSLGRAGVASHTTNTTYQIGQKLSLQHGRHFLKVGGQWLFYRMNRFYSGNNGVLGFFNYTGAFTGHPFADFLLDQLSSKGRGSVADAWEQTQHRIGLFAQDDFRLSSRLTVNLGLRWELTTPLVEVDDRQVNFDRATGRPLFAGQDGNSRGLYDAYYGGFEPRLGLAWMLNDRTVIRGGYGITQHMEGTGANLRLPQNPPFFFESAVNFDRTTGAGTITSGFADVQPGDEPVGQVRAYDPDLRPQFTQQWNAFVEYELAPATSLNVGYVGHHATHLVTPAEFNQPLPDPGPVSTWRPQDQRRPLAATAPLITNISGTASLGRSNYNALQASVRQRPSEGLELLGSYTLAKAQSDNIGYYGGGPNVAIPGFYQQNAYDIDADYGPSFFDVRHNVTVSGSYELPIGRGRTIGSDWGAAKDALLGGWRLSTILNLRSGFPVTIVDSRSPSQQGSRGQERPNCTSDTAGRLDNPTVDRWLDISPFTPAALGTFGNCPVGTARAPGYANVDLGLRKAFRMDDRREVELRFEIYNVFNRANYNFPGRDIADPENFGRITSTVSNPRTAEIAVKFLF